MQEDKVTAKMFSISETSILVEFGHGISKDIQMKVKAFADYIDEKPIKGMIEYIPAFTSVTLIYDPIKVKNEYKGCNDYVYNIVKNEINKILDTLIVSSNDKNRIVEIPVCYGGEFGPDLEYVATYNKISAEEVIKIHSEGEYLVYMIGFAPGFPYLGGMSEKIAAPRRKTPRTVIPKGSVGIAGMQTGVYPISTPGGWQLIGSTPMELFTPENKIPSLLKAGDIVKFIPISKEEHEKVKS